MFEKKNSLIVERVKTVIVNRHLSARVGSGSKDVFIYWPEDQFCLIPLAA